MGPQPPVRSVDLPAPLTPVTATISRAATVRSMSLSTTTWLYAMSRLRTATTGLATVPATVCGFPYFRVRALLCAPWTLATPGSRRSLLHFHAVVGLDAEFLYPELPAWWRRGPGRRSSHPRDGVHPGGSAGQSGGGLNRRGKLVGGLSAMLLFLTLSHS